ncbi:MAG: TolC family protein [Bacteroidales bacterium]
MTAKRILFLVILLGLWSDPLLGQQYPLQYLEQALENNPGLRAQYLDYEAATMQVDVATGLPAPELSAGFFVPSMMRFMGDQVFDASLMQMFPWFGTLSARGSAAQEMAGAAYHQYRNQRNTLYLEVTSRWFDLYQTSQQMNILNRFIGILKEREELVYSRYEGGVQSGGLALDIYRLEMQLNELENRYQRLQEDYTARERSFNILLNRDPDQQVQVPDTLLMPDGPGAGAFPDSAAFWANPAVARAQAQARAAEYEQELAVLNTRPVVGLGLQYSLLTPGDAAMGQMDGGSMVMPMVSVSLPIYGKKNRAMRRQGEIRAEMARSRQQNQVNDIAARWAQIAAENNNLARDRKFLESQLEVNRRAWELVVTSYSGGQEGFEELLRLQDQLLELEWRLLETIVGHHQAAARMDMLMARGVFE